MTRRPDHSQQCSKLDESACCENCWQLFHSPPREKSNGKASKPNAICGDSDIALTTKSALTNQAPIKGYALLRVTPPGKPLNVTAYRLPSVKKSGPNCPMPIKT